jgi:hypothetical protein
MKSFVSTSGNGNGGSVLVIHSFCVFLSLLDVFISIRFEELILLLVVLFNDVGCG